MYNTSNILHLYCIFTVHLTFSASGHLVCHYDNFNYIVFCKYVKVSHMFSFRPVYVLEPGYSVPAG